MSKYRGPRLRLVRKLGILPALTRKKCRSNERLNQTPGQHAKPKFISLRKKSAYGLQLLEKQKVRFNYNLNERQFVRYVKEAKRQNGPTGETLLTLLEMRLDNIVYRLNFAPTIAAARQLINHGHILINQKKVTVPSYACQLKDVVSVKQTSKSKDLIQNRMGRMGKKMKTPSHLSCDPKTLTGTINKIANRYNVQLRVNELLVVEYYSRS